MGLSFAEPVAANFFIREFAARDVENADGWGLAWYPDQSLALVKEALTWRKSNYSQFLQGYQRLQTRIVLAHVRRHTTGGEPTHADTHPFVREYAGREFCFAHNGTLREFHKLPLDRYAPVGDTDSERMFCFLMDAICRGRHDMDREKDWCWLHATLSDLNREGTINCLLSDGRRLFAYRDVTGWKGLTMRKLRFASHNQRHLEDAFIEVDVAGEAANHGCVLATRPLSATGWHELKQGELVVLEAGHLLFSSHSGRQRHHPALQ